MAEGPGKDTPNTDKTAPKSGPVKPPVLEGTARPAAGSKPAESIGPKPSDKTEKPVASDKPAAAKIDKPEPPKPTARPIPKADEKPQSGASPWLAGLAGGVLGFGLAYGFASLGYWPVAPLAAPAADPRLAQVATAVPELQTVTGTIQDELSTLNGRVAALESSGGDAAGGDTETLAADLAALSARVEALAAQPAAPVDDGTATQNSEAIAALETQLAQLQQQSASSAEQLAEAQSNIAALTESAGAAAEATVGVTQLPLVLSGLESAFANGRAFDQELAALRGVSPDLAVPEALASRAGTGLPRPDDVQRRLSQAIPDMLAGRPADVDADWQGATLDWFRGVVAMRPTGDVEGDGPEAIVARIEAAVARRDFAAAQSEFTALPAAMRAPAAEIAADIAALAEAETFLSAIRREALAGGSGA